jgi:hypothetical protein
LPSFPRTAFSASGVLSSLRFGQVSLDEAEHFLHNPSLRSDGLRDHPGMPFGFIPDLAFGYAGIPTQPSNMPLSIVAGLLDGTVAQYILPATSVHAQAQILAPKTLEAGAFCLVNEAGHVAGSLTINAAGRGCRHHV